MYSIFFVSVKHDESSFIPSFLLFISNPLRWALTRVLEQKALVPLLLLFK